MFILMLGNKAMSSFIFALQKLLMLWANSPANSVSGQEAVQDLWPTGCSSMLCCLSQPHQSSRYAQT